MTDINLIKRSGVGGAWLSTIEGRLRRIALWSLGMILVSGIATGVSYLFAMRNIRSLTGTKAEVVASINSQHVKEGLLLSLKERVTIASRALDAAKPWGKLFSVLGNIADGDSFLFIAVDESGQVNASLELDTLDEAVSVIANAIALANDRRIRSAQMTSFALREGGGVQLTMSFHPVF